MQYRIMIKDYIMEAESEAGALYSFVQELIKDPTFSPLFASPMSLHVGDDIKVEDLPF